MRLAAYAVEENGQIYLEELTAGDFRAEYRLTWIASDGTVLFDTKDSSGNMENHGDRVEVQEALSKGESSSNDKAAQQNCRRYQQNRIKNSFCHCFASNR